MKTRNVFCPRFFCLLFVIDAMIIYHLLFTFRFFDPENIVIAFPPPLPDSPLPKFDRPADIMVPRSYTWRNKF